MERNCLKLPGVVSYTLVFFSELPWALLLLGAVLDHLRGPETEVCARCSHSARLSISQGNLSGVLPPPRPLLGTGRKALHPLPSQT